MKILIVGAGAVGQVYGRHFALGGADVTFKVKPKHAEAARGGFTMYPLEGRRKSRPVRFEDFRVITTDAEVAAERWDQVWLAISATALRGDWLEEFLAAVGDAPVVTLQPGPEGGEHLAARLPPERLVTGLITFVSYQTPLEGESRPEPGVAYWLPPLTPTPLEGDREVVRAAVKTLGAGGLNARMAKGVRESVRWGSALLQSVIAALEVAGWSLGELRRSRIKLASAAAREATGIAAPGFRRGLTRVATTPWLMRLGIRIAPAFTPLPLETYLRYHFTKVGDQTRAALATYARRGEEQGRPHGAIDRLRDEIFAPRGEASRQPSG